MKNTIIITDPAQVRAGDKAYFHNCDFGFTVLDVDRHGKHSPLKVNIPMSKAGFWADPALFNHATREVEGPEWPDPDDHKLHVYLGTDDRRYIYNPIDEYDASPWVSEGSYVWHSSENMEDYYREALPLTELEIIHKDDNETYNNENDDGDFVAVTEQE